MSEFVRVDRSVYRRNALLALALDLLFLVLIAGFVVFYRVNDVSFHHVDESTHVRVTQEMMVDGEFWRPKVFGRYYYNKPPFKMWLSMVPVKIFGPTNFAFRFWDGVCGILSVIGVYLFGRTVFRSRTVAFIAALTLITSKAYVFHHGLRTATQDSMVNFLNMLSMFIGWRLLTLLRRESSSTKEGRKRVLMLAAMGGVTVGCAVLTKNVLGFLPLFLIGLFAFISGDLRFVLKRGKLAVGTVLALGLLFPFLYLLPHFLHGSSIWMVMFGDEVVERVTVGYHNQDRVLFYVKRLWSRAGAPPELLIPGIFFGLGYWIFRRERKHLFVLLWAVIPVLVFSFIPSRLTWYMVPAFVGCSFLCGIAFEVALKQFARFGGAWWRGASSDLLPAILFGAYLLASSVAILRHGGTVAAAVLDRDYRLALDKVSEEIHFSRELSDYTLLLVNDPKLARNERIYRDRIPLREVVSDGETLKKRLQDPKVGFVLASVQDFVALAPLRHIESYTFLPPETERLNWAVFISYVPGISSLESFRETTDVGGGEESRLLYGFGKVRMVGKVTVRRIVAPEAATILESDEAHASLTTILRLNAGMSDAKRVPAGELKVLINGKEAGVLKIAGERLRTYELPIRPGFFAPGKSVVSLVPVIPSMKTREDFLSGPIGINWISLEVLSGPGSEALETIKIPEMDERSVTPLPFEEENERE